MREISIEADSWQKPKCLGLALKQHSVKTQVECFSLPCFCYPFKSGGSDSPLSPQSCHLGSHGSPDLSALKILQKHFHALHVTAAHSRSPLGTHRHFRFEGMGFSHYMHHKELTEYQDPGSSFLDPEILISEPTLSPTTAVSGLRFPSLKCKSH